MAPSINYVQIPIALETSVPVEEKTTKTERQAIVPVVGAAMTVAVRSGGKGSSTVYANRTGGSTVASPETNAKGLVPYYLQEGSYTLTFTGGTPAIGPTSIDWDAVYGSGIDYVKAEAVVAETLGAGSVTAEKLASNAVTEAKIANNAVALGKLTSSVQTELNSVKTSAALNALKIATLEGQIRIGIAQGTSDSGGNISVTYGSPFPTQTTLVVASSVVPSSSPVFYTQTYSPSGFVAFFNFPNAFQKLAYIAYGH